MAPDPSMDARRAVPGPDRATADLVAHVRTYSRAVIESELRRLARRAPSLRRHDMDTIDAALQELTESLLLSRLRGLPQHTARLKVLFDTATEAP